MVRLGETEAAERLPRLEPRQPLLLLRLRAVGIDRIHHEAALHGSKRAQARIAALQLLHDEAIGDIVEAGAAIAFEGGAEDAHLPERLGDFEWERFVPVVPAHDGHELLLHPVTDGVPHHPLFFRQQCLDVVVVDAAIVSHR